MLRRKFFSSEGVGDDIGDGDGFGVGSGNDDCPRTVTVKRHMRANEQIKLDLHADV
jgi:hypothetical protein